MKVGILQTGHAPDELLPKTGDYDDMFKRLLGGEGFTFQTFNVVDGEFPDSLDDADAWLITGSKHGAYEDHPWIPPLETLIREIAASGAPLVGVCFGHQIIAQALGGTVEKFPGGWAVGHQTYQINGQRVSLNAWHQDQVTKLPDGASVIGSNAFCANAVLAIGGNILTIQPHPEFGSEVIEGLIKHRSAAVPAEHVQAAEAALEAETQRNVLRDMMIAQLKAGKTEAAQ